LRGQAPDIFLGKSLAFGAHFKKQEQRGAGAGPLKELATGKTK